MSVDSQPNLPSSDPDHNRNQARRPVVAIITNSKTPYRLHVHRRLAREITGIRLFSLFTHELSNSPWMLEAPPEIGPVSFGTGETAAGLRSMRQLARDWAKGGRIIDWLREHEAQAVVVAGYVDPSCLRVIRWCRRHGIACFLFGDSNLRGGIARGVKGWLKRLFVTRVVRSVTGVMLCGSLGRAYFEKYDAQPERIFYYPYEPDYGLIQNLSADFISSIAARFGFRPTRRRIVFSARMIEVKRPDLALQAFAAIADERPDWDLVLVGDGSLRPALEASVPASLRSRVMWTGFLGLQEEVSAIYRLSDVLLLPSNFEPWAVVVNEAAAAGLAIVSSDVVGASAELVEDGVNGRIFPSGDLRALADALLDVTSEGRTDAMKQASLALLRAWRDRADPVDGFRAALRYAGVLPRA
jgi:glycosyltransferase involved in cell wall biosynthesis